MPTPNPGNHDPFTPKPTASREARPASADAKQKLHDHAYEAAQTGRHYYLYGQGAGGRYEQESSVPDTKDRLTVVSHDEPVWLPGTPGGLIMQVTHEAAIGTPDLTRDEEIYSRACTAYLFYVIPGGLHVVKQLGSMNKPSERPPASMPLTAEEWQIARSAFKAAQQRAAESAAAELELEIGFFSEQDAEDLQSLLNRTWP